MVANLGDPVIAEEMNIVTFYLINFYVFVMVIYALHIRFYVPLTHGVMCRLHCVLCVPCTLGVLCPCTSLDVFFFSLI